MLEEIDAALIHLAQNPTELGPISDAVDLLTDTMLSHFAYEERELVAPLAQHGFYPVKCRDQAVPTVPATAEPGPPTTRRREPDAIR